MDGVLLVDKPIGPTSHDIVARARRALGERSIGHTGTLDPLAGGLLALVLGRATRLARFLSAGDKSYDAEIRLGVATDTYDAQGEPAMAPHAGAMPSRSEIDEALDTFRGTFLQQPPAYSAKKIAGQRSYAIARKARTESARPASPALPASPGPSALPAPVSVTARTIEVLAYDGDTVALRVDCSAGFYIRSLAHDLGQRLGIGAHLAALRRTRSGSFSIASAITMDELERQPDASARRLLPLSALLTDFQAVVLTADGIRRVLHGQDVGQDSLESLESQIPNPKSHLHVRLVDGAGELLAIAEPVAGTGLLHPSIVLR